MELYLIGVVHRDPLGLPALFELLDRIEPEAVCLEMSPFGLVWRERRAPICRIRLRRTLRSLPVSLRRHHQLRLVREMIQLPFEYRACMQYAGKRGVPLHLVDLNRPSRKHLPLIETEVLSEENLSNLVDRDDQDIERLFRLRYSRALRCLAEPDPWMGLVAGIDPRREAFLACRIRRIASRHQRSVYVGGWTHLIDGPREKSLFGLLRDLAPRRVILHHGEIEPAAVRHAHDRPSLEAPHG